MDHEIVHFGVKGMRWGVRRRSRPALGRENRKNPTIKKAIAKGYVNDSRKRKGKGVHKLDIRIYDDDHKSVMIGKAAVQAAIGFAAGTAIRKYLLGR